MRRFTACLLFFVMVACTTIGQTPDAVPSNTLTPELTSFAAQISRTAFGFGMEAPVMIVSDFVDVQAVYTHFGTFVADKISEFLSSTPAITVVNRHSLEVLLDEIALQQSGIISRDGQVTVGEFTGASVVVTGSIVDLGEFIELNAEVTKIETGVSRRVSHRIEKTRQNMTIIDSIIDVESVRAAEVAVIVELLERQIELKQQELDSLLEDGRREIENRLAAEEAEKRAELAVIEAELREKSVVLTNLRQREADLAGVEQIIAEIEDRLRALNDRFQFLRLGMTVREVERVLDARVTIVVGGMPSAFNRAFSGIYYSAHGSYLISWNSRNSPIVMGWFDMTNNRVYRVSP